MTKPLPDSSSESLVDAATYAQRPYVRGDGTTIPPDKLTKAKSTPNSSYQNYLFGSAGSGDQPAWSDSMKGRAAIRLISRGVVGAAFFTVGSRMVRAQIRGYHPQHWQWDASKPLQAIAKGIDSTLGRAIEGSVNKLSRLKHDPKTAASIARDSVTFRNLREFSYMADGAERHVHGRSYGAEIVSFTFDFAMASIGDAGTRNIIQALDPNIKKPWLLNDNGEAAARGENWHIDWAAWVASTAKSTWRVFSKNQGEDWVAAIPYAFQMKFQRQFLSNIFNKGMNGYQLVFDNSWTGGAYRLDSRTNKIVGDYQLAAALDLHARFVGYNWYTLMFREGYDAIGNSWKQWKNDGFAIHPHLPEHFNPLTYAVDAVGSSLRYVTKSFIKANMYMNLAVIPFWMVRVPQSKWRGEHFVDNDNRLKLTHHPSIAYGKITIDCDLPSDPQQYRVNPFDPANYKHYNTESTLNKVEKVFSRALNPIGAGSFYLGEKAARLSDRMAAKGWWPQKGMWSSIFDKDSFTGRVIPSNRHILMHEYINASLSYTPYMYAKQEIGLRVDDSKGDGNPGEMDKAIYRFMDDVAAFRFSHIGKDIKHMWKLGTNFEREVKAREGEDPEIQVKRTSTPLSTVPATRVHTGSVVHHDPASLSHANPSNDADNNNRLWAQTMSADNNKAWLHSGGTTRH